MLLHSRFTSQDRYKKSRRLERWLGKDAWKNPTTPNVIVVATQVVEVGLNISAGVLHTELAPANALVQRFGRCARFAQQHGDVIVYPIAADDNGKVAYRPYDDTLCRLPGTTSRSHCQRRQRVNDFGFAEEQELIDAVHTAEDQRMLDHYSAEEVTLRKIIVETLATHEPDKRSQLIRDVDSIAVLIHPEPNQAITTKPFTWTAFSLRPGTLQGVYERLRQRQAEMGIDWVMKQLIAAGEQEAGAEEDSRREAVYTWQDVRDRSRSGEHCSLHYRPNWRLMIMNLDSDCC